jgi:hypothetical protein
VEEYSHTRQTGNKERHIMMITIEVKAQPGKVKELYRTLQVLIPTRRNEMSCQTCRVTKAVEYNGKWKKRA